MDDQKRKISHYIIYYTIGRTAIFYTAVLVSLWPYLNKLDPDADKTFLGYLAAGSALSSTIFGPIFGKITDLIKDKRNPFLFNLFFGFIYYVIYIFLPLFPTGSARYWFLLARIFAGINDVNMTLSRCYIAESTFVHERRKAVSILTACQTIGLGLGPALQPILVPLGEKGVWIIEGYVKLDMYSAVGWLGIISIIINAILFHPKFFYNSDLRHANHKEPGAKKDSNQDYKLLAWLFIFLHFILVANYVFLKVLGTPIVMDTFAMSRPDALEFNSYVVTGSAIAAFLGIYLMDYFCDKWGEFNLLCVGFVINALGRFINYPMGGSHIQVAMNQTQLGCPQWSQPWCIDERQLYKSQFIISNVVENVGYTWGVTLLFTQVSKVLGHRHQGIWMGLMTSMSGWARIIAPIIISNIYAAYGVAISILTSNFGFGVSSMVNLALIYHFLQKERCSGVSTPEDEVNGSLLHDNTSKIDDKDQG